MDAPQDRFYVCYIIVFMLGMGMLWPYNTLITVSSYFTDLFPSHSNIETLIPIMLMVPSTLCLIPVVIWGKHVSLRVRIPLALAVFAITTLCVYIAGIYHKAGSINESETYIIDVIMMILVGMFTALISSSLFGFVSNFPPQYTQAVMSGNGAAGILISLIRLSTYLGYRNTPDGGVDESVEAYFVTSIVFIVFCIVLFFIMIQLPFAKHFMRKREDPLHDTQPLLGENLEERSTLEILKAVLYIGSSVTMVFVCTFMIFPGLVTQLHSTDSHLEDQLYSGILLLLEFNIVDFIGRSMPSLVILLKKEHMLLATTLRLLFYPFFVYAWLGTSASSNTYVYIVMALFAFTNGYFSSLCMIWGPTYVTTSKEKETAGFIMTLFLNLGIPLGSTIAVLLSLAGIGS